MIEITCKTDHCNCASNAKINARACGHIHEKSLSFIAIQLKGHGHKKNKAQKEAKPFMRFIELGKKEALILAEILKLEANRIE